MKWQLTDETLALVRKLYELEQQRSWLTGRTIIHAQLDLLEQIASKGELAAIASAVSCLFSEAPVLRIAAGHAIERLLADTPPMELLHLNDVVAWSWRWNASGPWDRLRPRDIGPLVTDLPGRTSVLGLLSCHASGYVRHEAVRLLSDIRDGTELPYLLIRQNDWVEPIAKSAESAFRERIADVYLSHIVRNLPLVVHLSGLQRRDHSDVIRRVIELLLLPDHDDVLASIIQSEHRIIRRWLVRAAVNFERHRARVVKHGLKSDDPILRLLCLRLVPLAFAEKEARAIVQERRGDSFTPVRIEAIWRAAHLAAGDTSGIWRDALLDTSVSIREMAQSQLRKSGAADVAPIYRETLSQNPECLPALLGLGETGDESDLPAIRRYLTSELSSRRRAALRGLGRICGEVATDELIQFLRDDSRGVTKAAEQQLAGSRRTLSGESLLAVVEEDGRPHCREAAVKLIFNMGKWQSLPWLIHATGHSDPNTATLARQFIEAWFSPPLCNKVWTKPSKAENEAIQAALVRSKGWLEPQFRDKLNTWLRAI